MFTPTQTNINKQHTISVPFINFKPFVINLACTFTLALSAYAPLTSFTTFWNIGLYALVCLTLCGALAGVAFIFSLSYKQDGEKKSEYECGFEPFDNATRLPFDVHYYLVGILFLIFDVEIALLFPWVLSLNEGTWFGFFVRINFIVLLAIGFTYEWDRGALIWSFQQKEESYKPFAVKDTAFKFLLVITAVCSGVYFYLEFTLLSDLSYMHKEVAYTLGSVYDFLYAVWRLLWDSFLYYSGLSKIPACIFQMFALGVGSLALLLLTRPYLRSNTAVGFPTSSPEFTLFFKQNRYHWCSIAALVISTAWLSDTLIASRRESWIVQLLKQFSFEFPWQDFLQVFADIQTGLPGDIYLPNYEAVLQHSRGWLIIFSVCSAFDYWHTSYTTKDRKQAVDAVSNNLINLVFTCRGFIICGAAVSEPAGTPPSMYTSAAYEATLRPCSIGQFVIGLSVLTLLAVLIVQILLFAVKSSSKDFPVETSKKSTLTLYKMKASLWRLVPHENTGEAVRRIIFRMILILTYEVLLKKNNELFTFKDKFLLCSLILCGVASFFISFPEAWASLTEHLSRTFKMLRELFGYPTEGKSLKLPTKILVQESTCQERLTIWGAFFARRAKLPVHFWNCFFLVVHRSFDFLTVILVTKKFMKTWRATGSVVDSVKASFKTLGFVLLILGTLRGAEMYLLSDIVPKEFFVKYSALQGYCVPREAVVILFNFFKMTFVYSYFLVLARGFVASQIKLIKFVIKNWFGAPGSSTSFLPFAVVSETFCDWQRVFFVEPLSYREEILTGFGVERFLAVLIAHLLLIISQELKRKTSKQVLAETLLSGVCYTLNFLAIAYLAQYFSNITYQRFNGYLRVSVYTVSIKALTRLVCSFVLVNSRKYVTEHGQKPLEYALVFTLAAFFRRAVISSANFRTAFRSIVGFSLNLYVLILFDSSKSGAREAGAKYYFLSTFSSGLRLYGIFSFFVIAGTLSFSEAAQSLSLYTTIASPLRLQISLALLLVGIFFKLSAFPGQLWAPEVYEGSPDPITAFFRLPVKITVLAFLISILRIAFAPLTIYWQSLLVLSAGLSLLWGSFGALAEKSTKRFLAYASINQIGFLLLGLSTASFSGCQSTIVYLFIYTVRNVGFLIRFLNSRRYQGGQMLYLTDFRGLGQQNWLISWSSARRLFSRAGIPPLAGFFGKYFLLISLQSKGRYSLVIAALFTSLLGAYYYLRIVKTLWFEGNTSRIKMICSLTSRQQTTLFAAEAILWLFAVFSGAVLLLAKDFVESLF